jgi:hypothetical protein
MRKENISASQNPFVPLPLPLSYSSTSSHCFDFQQHGLLWSVIKLYKSEDWDEGEAPALGAKFSHK